MLVLSASIDKWSACLLRRFLLFISQTKQNNERKKKSVSHHLNASALLLLRFECGRWNVQAHTGARIYVSIINNKWIGQ